jgi:hypothetical protein
VLIMETSTMAWWVPQAEYRSQCYRAMPAGVRPERAMALRDSVPPWGNAPYGDDSKDLEQINNGIWWYRNCYPGLRQP